MTLHQQQHKPIKSINKAHLKQGNQETIKPSTPEPVLQFSLTTLSVTFDLFLNPHQLPQFRGAISEAAGLGNDLFHNHDNVQASAKATLRELTDISTRLHYRYPKVQYRTHQRKAAIFAMQKGCDALRNFLLTNGSKGIYMQNELVPLRLIHLQEKEHTLGMTNQPQHYKMFRWLALNEVNYQAWQKCNNLVERIQLLERILNSHILSFGRGIDWEIPEQLQVSIQHIQKIHKVRYHGTPLLAFDITYSLNALLPPYIALGKAVSHGFGWQKPVKLANQDA